MIFVYFKRLKSPTTWLQFRLALSPQNSLGFQSLPDHHYAHQVKPVSSIKFCLHGEMEASKALVIHELTQRYLLTVNLTNVFH